MGEHEVVDWVVEWSESDGWHSVDLRDLNTDQLVILRRSSDPAAAALIDSLLSLRG